jgi:hypothetical protein
MVNSRAKGIGAEQAVARYFRDVASCPDARRSVAAGWRNGSTSSPDRGDIDGVPGLCVQVKNLARPLAGKLLSDTWFETLEQAAASARRPMIIEKCRSSDVGYWWAHVDARFYVELVTGCPQLILHNHLMRAQLGDLMPSLRLWIHSAKRVDTH